jgi:hypothetical protein
VKNIAAGAEKLLTNFNELPPYREWRIRRSFGSDVLVPPEYP